MKKLLLAIVAIVMVNGASAQFIKRMADRAKNKLEQKAGDKVDKGVDEATEIKKKEKKKEETKEDKTEPAKEENVFGNDTPSDNNSSGENKTTPKDAPALKTYSKYDFIPGDKILVYENFAQDAVGDFPGKWNTNSSGEIVTIEGKEGHWFQISKAGAFHPEFITSFPDNFTLEFDLGVNNDFNYYSSELYMSFVNLEKPDQEYSDWGNYSRWNGKHGVRMNIHPNGGQTGKSHIVTSVSGSHIIDNSVNVKEFNVPDKNISHIAIWRQNQRMRVYVNNEKIWDLPKAFGTASTYNSLVFGIGGMHQDQDFYIFNNIRLAVGAPDTRNKLITEGKFVTTGILFDVNSDVVKAESYGTIKEIANVLKENATVKVKIIGHTDSDGDDKTNLDLSKRRAASVKKALVSEFAIDESRIETDGKGESQPVDKSDTPVGKANNRRVEFIKL